MCVQKSEESIRSSEAEQWTIPSHRVGAGNHIMVLWKGSQCSKLLSLLSSSTLRTSSDGDVSGWVSPLQNGFDLVQNAELVISAWFTI